MGRVAASVVVASLLVAALAPAPAGAGAARARIPAAARVLTVTVSRNGRRLAGPLTTADAARVRRIARLVDALSPSPPGVRACPADFGIHVTFAFRRARRTRALATAVADPAGCAVVLLSLPGRSRVALDGGAGLIAAAERVLGVVLPTAPSAGGP